MYKTNDTHKLYSKLPPQFSDTVPGKWEFESAKKYFENDLYFENLSKDNLLMIKKVLQKFKTAIVCEIEVIYKYFFKNYIKFVNLIICTQGINYHNKPKVGSKRTRDVFEINEHNTITDERLYNLARKYDLS